MPGTPPSTVTSLTPEERGFVAGLLALGAERAAAKRVLGAENAVTAWSSATDLPREQRATAWAGLLQELVAPLPPGIEALDPSWVAEALAGEPAGLVSAAGLDPEVHPDRWPLDPEVLAQLRRLLFAALEPLTVAPAGPLGAGLASLDGPALLAEVARRGARAVGTSLSGASLELRARAMAAAGAPWSSELGEAAAHDVDPATREAARLLVARAAALPAATAPEGGGLRAAGLLALAEVLAAEGPASLRRVAGRLPAALGRLLLAS